MKKFILLTSLLVIALSKKAVGQIGIYTAVPEATLDIRGKNDTGTSGVAVPGAVTSTDGVLVPRVSNLATNGSVNGQLVYLVADAGSFTKGFYYWNGKRWTGFTGSASAGDTTNDAWVNDNTNIMVKLGTESNGSTARAAGTDFVAKDNGAVGIGTASPDSSAILDVTASNKGILIPRIALTGKTDITTISSPATGLIVYNTADSGTGINKVRANTMYRFANGAWDNLVTMGDLVNENQGGEVFKIQAIGTPDPDKTVIAGPLEFRLRSGSPATALEYDCRLVVNPGSATVTVSRSTMTGIGTTPTNTRQTYTFTSANWNSWVKLEDIVIQGGGHHTYLSLVTTGSSLYHFYVLNVQRIGNSNNTTGLKSLIINKY